MVYKSDRNRTEEAVFSIGELINANNAVPTYKQIAEHVAERTGSPVYSNTIKAALEEYWQREKEKNPQPETPVESTYVVTAEEAQYLNKLAGELAKVRQHAFELEREQIKAKHATDLATKEADKNFVDAENDKLCEENTALEGSVKGLQKNLDETTAAKIEAEGKLNSLLTSNNILTETNQTMQGELAQAKVAEQSAITELASIKATFEAQTIEFNQSLESNKTLQARISKFEIDHAKLNETHKNTLDANSDLKKSLEAKQTEITQVRADAKSELDQARKEAKAELDQLRKEAKAAQTEAETKAIEAAAQAAELQARIKSLQSELDKDKPEKSTATKQKA